MLCIITCTAAYFYTCVPMHLLKTARNKTRHVTREIEISTKSFTNVHKLMWPVHSRL